MARKSASKLFPDEEPKSKPLVEEPEVDIDVSLSAIRKKRIRINGDNSKILELNTSDMSIASRLHSAYNKLIDMVKEVRDSLPDDVENLSDEENVKILETLDTIDNRMREQVDYIFNAPVSAVCGEDGSMWDPYEGSFKFEHIIETLLGLYENNLSKEFSQMQSKVNNQLQEHRKAVSKYHK